MPVTKTKPVKAKTVPMVVTTKHRGVFFGYGVPDLKAEEIEITDAQMCVSWTADIRGVTGLAAVGPSKSCRIGLKVPKMIVRDITAIFVCTEEAAKKWDSAPWV